MRELEGFNREESTIPSYKELQYGKHPDIADSVAAKMPLYERRQLAAHLALRDLFTPMCENLAIAAVELTSRDIREMRSSFERAPKVLPYAENYDALLKQLRGALDNYTGIIYPGHASENKAVSDLALPEASDICHILASMQLNIDPDKIDYTEVLDCASGRFDEFIFAPTELPREQSRKNIFAPVGAYGRETTRKLVETGRILVSLAEGTLADQAQAIASDHDQLLHETTARAQDVYRLRYRSTTEDLLYPLATVEEGIESLVGAVSFFIPERIQGISDGDKAVSAVLLHDLPSQLASRTPMGFLMPKLLAGRYVPSMITVRNGRPMLSDAAKKLFDVKMESSKHERKYHEKFDEKYPVLKKFFDDANTWNEEMDKRTGIDPVEMEGLDALGFGCPVSRGSRVQQDSGLEMLSVAFDHVYKAL